VEFYCKVLEPLELNRLHREGKNLNRILDWAYRELIEEILSKEPSAKITVDAYSHRNPFGSLVSFEHKAEEKVEVACASMKARAEFLRWLEKTQPTKGDKQRGDGACKENEGSGKVFKGFLSFLA
jgi:ribonuclease HIII